MSPQTPYAFARDKTPWTVKLAVFLAVVGVMGAVRLGVFGHRVMPIAFGVPLVVFAWMRDRKLLWITVAVFAAVTVAKYFFFGDVKIGEHVLTTEERIEDVGLVLADLIVIAAVLHILMGTADVLERSNVELNATNDELAAREEEITHQNEELQSQTEELERQSEELRVANEEMAQRERMLQTLLDLSRSINVKLGQDETFGRICETLGQLVNGPTTAAAILLMEDGGLRVRCHYGFGPAGLARDEIPRAQGFGYLVIEQGRTAYLEDLSLRPELEIPQPASGEKMASVLATPLIVRGKPIGTLEVYSTACRTWDDQQIALAESLAAQTSTSLENSELFEEVDEGRRRLQTLFDQVPVGVAVVNKDLSEFRLNPAGAMLLGMPTDANLAGQSGRAWVLYSEGKPLPTDRYPLARAARGERVYPHELEVVLPSGRRIAILSSASPFSDAEGKTVGAVASFVDITQIKQLQRELETRRREAEEANMRKTRFLAAASHDIRTPANAISLLAELLKRTADSPSMATEIPQLAEELQASANSLVNLVTNILDVTRFDTDKLELHETEFPLSTLIEEEVRQASPLAQVKKLSIEIEPRSAAVWLRADRIKLGRVMGNLIGNAIKFTDQGGIRVASARNGDGTVEISVSDTGIGISSEHQSRIFDEFFQLSDPQRSKGSGLGLTICKRLVEAMGGTISVNSKPRAGSKFTVTLPPSTVLPRAAADGEAG